MPHSTDHLTVGDKYSIPLPGTGFGQWKAIEVIALPGDDRLPKGAEGQVLVRDIERDLEYDTNPLYLQPDLLAPIPKFSAGQRVHTHECNVCEVVGVSGISPVGVHGVTGSRLPAEVWYDLRRDDGSRGIFSELHLRLAS